MASSCDRCGAEIAGLVCRACGARLGKASDVEAERKALDELHLHLSGAEPTAQHKLLATGFIPDHAPNLVEAGLRCVALLDSHDTTSPTSKGAVGRLSAIVAKLRIVGETPETTRALQEFAARVDDWKGRDRRLDRIVGGGCLLVLAALVAGAIWLARRIWG